MSKIPVIFDDIASHPTRVRGLKWRTEIFQRGMDPVAPYAGAWIEIN